MQKSRNPKSSTVEVAPEAIETTEGEKVEAGEKTRYFGVFVCPPEVPISQEHVLAALKEVGKIKSPKEQTALHMALHSSGGDIYSAYKIVNVLREYACELRIMVPLYAKSAATLLALGADEIIMGPQSELGPLDLPIEHPLVEGIRISALDGVRPIDVLARVATEIAIGEVGIRLRQEVRLGRKDSVELALRFASDYITPIVAKLDPSVVNQCFRELGIAQTYGQDLLETYMLANQDNKEAEAERIAESLVWDYPAHEFAICFREAKKLGLKVCVWRDYKYWQPLWEAFIDAGKTTKGVFRILPEKEFLLANEKSCTEEVK